MSKKITLDIDIHSSCTILTNENGDIYKFEPYKEGKEDLYEFLLGCKIVDDVDLSRLEDK